MDTLSRLFTIFISWVVKLYKFKIQVIKKYPVPCAIIAFLEGVIIGIIIYHYFFQTRFSCCFELGY